MSAKAKLAVTQAELMGTKKRFDAVQGELSRDTQFERDNQEEVKQTQKVLLGLRMEMQEGRKEWEPKGSNLLTSFTTELTSSDLGSLGQTKSVPTDESDITTEEGRADEMGLVVMKRALSNVEAQLIVTQEKLTATQKKLSTAEAKLADGEKRKENGADQEKKDADSKIRSFPTSALEDNHRLLEASRTVLVETNTKKMQLRLPRS